MNIPDAVACAEDRSDASVNADAGKFERSIAWMIVGAARPDGGSSTMKCSMMWPFGQWASLWPSRGARASLSPPGHSINASISPSAEKRHREHWPRVDASPLIVKDDIRSVR